MPKRNYRNEYDSFQGKPEQKKNRAKRNKARRDAEKAGKVKKGDKKHDIDHRRKLSKGGSNSKKNTRVRNASANRSDNGHVKGEKHKKRGGK